MKYYQMMKKEVYKMRKDLMDWKAIMILVLKIMQILILSKCSQKYLVLWEDLEDHIAKILLYQSSVIYLNHHFQEYLQLALNKTKIMMKVMNKQNMIQTKKDRKQNIYMVIQILILSRNLSRNLNLIMRNIFIYLMKKITR